MMISVMKVVYMGMICLGQDKICCRYIYNLHQSLLHLCTYWILCSHCFQYGPTFMKGGNNTRCISYKRAALYINLMQAPPLPIFNTFVCKISHGRHGYPRNFVTQYPSGQCVACPHVTSICVQQFLPINFWKDSRP